MVKKRFSVGDLFALPAENDVGCAVGQIVLERDSGQYFVAIASDFFDHFEDAMRFSNQNPQVILAAVVLDEYLLSGKWEVFSNDSVWSSVSFPVYKVLTPQGIDESVARACVAVFTRAGIGSAGVIDPRVHFYAEFDEPGLVDLLNVVDDSYGKNWPAPLRRFQNGSLEWIESRANGSRLNRFLISGAGEAAQKFGIEVPFDRGVGESPYGWALECHSESFDLMRAASEELYRSGVVGYIELWPETAKYRFLVSADEAGAFLEAFDRSGSSYGMDGLHEDLNDWLLWLSGRMRGSLGGGI